MKKFWIPAVAVCALSLSACCGNKSENNCKSTCTTQSCTPPADNDDIVTIMTEALEKGDTVLIVQVVTMTQEKMDDLIAKGKKSKAAELADKLDHFVKTNEAKIKELHIGATLTKAAEEAKAKTKHAVHAAEATGDRLKDDVITVADSVKAKTVEVADAAKEKAEALADSTKKVAERAGKKLGL